MISLERRIPSDIAFGLGTARKLPLANPPSETGPHSAKPVVETMTLVPKENPIPKDGRTITIETDGSRIVASPATPDDEISNVLKQAIEYKPVRQSGPPTDNPFVNLGRFNRGLSNGYLSTAVNSRWVRRR